MLNLLMANEVGDLESPTMLILNLFNHLCVVRCHCFFHASQLEPKSWRPSLIINNFSKKVEMDRNEEKRVFRWIRKNTFFRLEWKQIWTMTGKTNSFFFFFSLVGDSDFRKIFFSVDSNDSWSRTLWNVFCNSLQTHFHSFK